MNPSTLPVLFFLSSLFLHPAGFHENRPLTDLTIQSWTTEDGLISNSTTGVVQTPDGFLWVSSYNGVSRFDGTRFRLYSTRNSDAFRTNAVIGMHVDLEGTLWLATQGSGILKYEDETFVRLENMPNSTRFVCSGKNGELLAGTNGYGLYQIVENEATRIFEDELQGTINAAVYDNKGNLWVGTDTDGLIRLDASGNVTRYTIEDSLLSNAVYSLLFVGDELLIGTAGGLNKLKNQDIQSSQPLSGVAITMMRSDDEGNVWFATEAGLFRHHSRTGRFSVLNEQNGFPGRQVTSLLFDLEGSLWTTTDKGGVIQLQSSQISNISTEEGLTSDDVNIVLQDGKQKLIGLDNGDIFIVRDQVVSKLQLLTPMNQIGIRDLLRDSEGRLWIASYNGLIRKEGDSEFHFNETNGLPDMRIRRLLEKDNFLWIATRGGLFKFKDNEVVETYDKSWGLGSNYIMSLAVDNQRNLLIGTKDGGLNILRNDETVTTHYPGNSPEGWLIFNMEVDENDHIWLATNSGIYIFADDSFRRIASEAGLPTDTYFDIIKDDKGNTWMTSHLGLFRFRNEALLDYTIGKVDELYYDLYDESDGMKSRECTAATPSCLDSEGALYVPTFAGVSIINPGTLEVNKYIPPVHISGVSSNLEQLDLRNKKIVFDPGPNQFEIEYASLSFFSPEKVRYQYRMKGFEDDWISTSKSSVRYSNLPHGEYEFEVIGSNNHGIWNEEVASIQVVVLPYFYQTTGFYLVVLTLSLVSLILIYYWRITIVERNNKELRKLNAELDSFVYSTSHDLRAPLASIQGLINIAKIETTPDAKDTYMKLMEKSVSKLDTFIKDIINYSRNSRLEVAREKIDFSEMIDEVFSVLYFHDTNDNIHKIINIDQNIPFYSDHRRLFIILNNLISNAFQYQKQNGEEKIIEVSVVVKSDQAEITIRDNGIGIPKDSIKRVFHMFYRASNKSAGSGLGLYIVRETLNKLHGTVSVESEEDEGTQFKITIPNAL